eukprot:6615672-Prymnesium_polylepis.1
MLVRIGRNLNAHGPFCGAKESKNQFARMQTSAACHAAARHRSHPSLIPSALSHPLRPAAVRACAQAQARGRPGTARCGGADAA